MYVCMSTRTTSVMCMIYVYMNEKMYNDNTEQNEYYDITQQQQQQQQQQQKEQQQQQHTHTHRSFGHFHKIRTFWE